MVLVGQTIAFCRLSFSGGRSRPTMVCPTTEGRFTIGGRMPSSPTCGQTDDLWRSRSVLPKTRKQFTGLPMCQHHIGIVLHGVEIAFPESSAIFVGRNQF